MNIEIILRNSNRPTVFSFSIEDSLLSFMVISDIFF